MAKFPDISAAQNLVRECVKKNYRGVARTPASYYHPLKISQNYSIYKTSMGVFELVRDLDSVFVGSFLE